MANKESQSISLKIMVDKEKHQVLFAEADSAFIDVLFSFMTIPLGTITKLTHDKSIIRGDVGCLNNLYLSVENLAAEFLQNMECKDMVLNPRSAAELDHRKLKLNWIDCNISEYYICHDIGPPTMIMSFYCRRSSCYQTAHCRCGNTLKYKVKLLNPTFVSQEGGVFVKPASRFIVSDDFQVMPISTMTGITLLGKLGVQECSKIEERTVIIGKTEVLKLLMCSLTSKTPFTDAFLEPPTGRARYSVHCAQSSTRSMIQVNKAMQTEKKTKSIRFKLIFHKPKNKALYAEVEEDFFNLLCSFLTIPLGFVFKHFPSLNSRGCITNLYKSIKDCDCFKYFISADMKDTVVNPKLASGLAQDNQLIGIEQSSGPSYSYLASNFRTVSSNFNFNKSHPGIEKGFVKEASTFMVEDNLTVTPLSLTSSLSLAKKLNLALCDISEKEVIMYEDQALQLLAASLVSEHALTDVFVLGKSKQEQ